MRNKIVACGCLVFVSMPAVAAIQKSSVSQKHQQGSFQGARADFKGALQLPLNERLEFYNKQGPRALHELNKIAFDKTENLDNRWRALTALVRIHPRESQPFIERALKSDEWYMRNAALVVLPYSERKWAVNKAIDALDDSALIVRTAAVKALRQLHATESSPALWQKLNDQSNFHRGEPLWIRRHIIEALEQFSTVHDKERFQLAVKDSDQSVRKVAQRVLARY